ncbi:MAG: hypothetical protein QOJ89_3807 [bacterium]|jgi:DNA-binding NarL/FixJ family response regulator
MNTKLLVADDQAMVRHGLRMIIQAEPDMDVIAEAADGEHAVAAARRFSVDIVLMDIRMPKLDGIAATRRILAQPEPPRILILTTFDLDEYVYEALRAGASGFLLKNSPPEQLIDAIRVVARGDALLDPAVTRAVIERFVQASPRAETPSQAIEELTTREREVLTLIAHGLSNAEIAQRLHLGVGTIKTHVGNILMKLDLRDRTQAAVYAYETGVIRPRGG